MINPGMAQAGIRWAAFIVVLAALMLLVVRPGTPQFVITVFTLALGLLFGVVIFVLSRVRRRD